LNRESIASGGAMSKTIQAISTIYPIGVTVNAFEVVGRLPELAIDLDDGSRFITFTNWTTQPGWSIGFKDRSLFPLDPGWKGIDLTPWIHVVAGRIVIEYCYDDTKASVRNAIKRIGFA